MVVREVLDERERPEPDDFFADLVLREDFLADALFSAVSDPAALEAVAFVPELLAFADFTALVFPPLLGAVAFLPLPVLAVPEVAVLVVAAGRWDAVLGFASSSTTVICVLDVERVVTGILSPRQNLCRAQNSREPSRAEFHCGTGLAGNQTAARGFLPPPGRRHAPRGTTTV